MSKTIAQMLNVKEFPFIIKDSKGKEIYYEDSKGFWSKLEYHSNGKQIYFENSDGFWSKREYDSNGNIIYWEDSDGLIDDKRQSKTEVTLKEISKKFNIPIDKLRIKD